MKKIKFWLILIVVLSFFGFICYTTYVFVVENMEKIELEEQDFIPPTLVLEPVTILEGKDYSVYSFVSSCKDDVSKKCQIEFLNEEMGGYKDPGTYDISIVATDDKENRVEAQTTLTITLETPESPEKSTDIKKEDQSKEVVVSKVGSTSIDSIQVMDIYGTTCEYKITTYYDLYSDGSKKETGKTEQENGCNFQTYHATLDELNPEVVKQLDTYRNNITEAFGFLNQERLSRGLSGLTIDSSLIKAAQYRTLEIGYSNMYSLSRPNSSISILDELNISYTGAIEFIATGSMDARLTVSSVLSDPTFQSCFNQDSFSKIGIGLSLVHNQYIWVFYLIS